MNPQSAAAALQALAGLCGPGRRLTVFGEMLELGEQSLALHRGVGAEVVRTRQDVLVCVGAGARPIAEGALAAGMPAANVHCVADLDEAFVLLRDSVREGDRVLCKASRRVALDRLVDRLLAERATPASGGPAAAEASEGA
jgi:UDP-N-acetylmuramoyl-tripeptide--D-alanyl-D-alanine ligase